MKTVVLGVGNVIMGDEGIGVHCIEWLVGRLPPGVIAIFRNAIRSPRAFSSSIPRKVM